MTDQNEQQVQSDIFIGSRPWGKYVVLFSDSEHKIKEITVKPGARLSLQRHQKREEHWYIRKGKAIVTLNGQQVVLERGQSINIPRFAIHRIANCGETDLIFVEVQTGDYFGEDDIERLEDDYSRT